MDLRQGRTYRAAAMMRAVVLPDRATFFASSVDGPQCRRLQWASHASVQESIGHKLRRRLSIK
ncbi:MAG: hypothetical protein IMW92_14290 [Bacillales bacterium]|nr:hypothetical protein [Bacillales bacterium]